MSETKLATVRFGIQSDVIDDTEIQNLIESYHREYIKFICQYQDFPRRMTFTEFILATMNYGLGFPTGMIQFREFSRLIMDKYFLVL